MEPLKAQRATSLRAVTPTEVALACERLAVGYGLPKDGHLVHSCLQGQAIYHFMGGDGGLKVFAMQGTESKWNQAGSKLPLIVLAGSAAGKDNLKALVTAWLDQLQAEYPRATAFTAQGNWTVSGVIKKLKGNQGQLQFLQSEMDKFIQKKRPQYLQEADLIELLDGSSNFGKGNQQEDICLAPHVWALVFSTRTAGSVAMSPIRTQECYTNAFGIVFWALLPIKINFGIGFGKYISFNSKFLEVSWLYILHSTRSVYMNELGHSDSCGRLRFVVLTLDSSQVRATLFEEKMQPRSCSMDLVTGILRNILRAQHKQPVPEVQERDQESQGDRPADRRLRLRKPQEPSQPPSREIDEVNFTGAAGCVFAGLQDGAAQACANVGQEHP